MTVLIFVRDIFGEAKGRYKTQHQRNEILMSFKQIIYVNKDLIMDLETRQRKYMYMITDNTIFKDKNSDKS